MCDYSLEVYASRAAVDGEDLVVKQFSSGSKGFVEEPASDCAVCCKDGVEMTLHLSGIFQTRKLVKKELAGAENEKFDGEIPVTFRTLASGQLYLDGFILPSGRYLSIQRLSPGTRATVIKALPKELTEALNLAKEDFEHETWVKPLTAVPTLV